MASKHTIEWREKNKDFIQKWQKKMEVMQSIVNQTMRDVFLFSKNYIAQHKSGKFRNWMAGVLEEIIQYGIVEPRRLNSIKKAIENFWRKIK